ncbi:abortive infection family protein [Cephaloticoccus primus]|uniref:abortive infection family protein n=1 Tax=Cephaloticoccus primus TaxID=1548207 RepID=UPI0009EDFAC2|nr:abortive infection family protein [Cephaloticoccus primus]
MKITDSTRKDIIYFIKYEKVSWPGRLNPVDFLDRIFDLDKLPSEDSRLPSARSDIYKHCIQFHNWDDDWVFYDERFNLIGCDDTIFLKFICEMLHPVVRTNSREVNRLHQEFNKHLQVTGFEIIKKNHLPGYGFIDRNQVPSLNSMRETFQEIGSEYIKKQIDRIYSDLNKGEVDRVIGTAKELIETCCKSILEERGKDSQNGNIMNLLKCTLKVLNLAPEDTPEQAKAKEPIKKLLNALLNIVQNIAELRNHYGTGHGRQASAKGLQLRHAKLVAGAASTLALFLMDTHEERPF